MSIFNVKWVDVSVYCTVTKKEISFKIIQQNKNFRIRNITAPSNALCYLTVLERALTIDVILYTMVDKEDRT